MAFDFIWTGAGGPSFDTAASWLPNGVPGDGNSWAILEDVPPLLEDLDRAGVTYSHARVGPGYRSPLGSSSERLKAQFARLDIDGGSENWLDCSDGTWELFTTRSGSSTSPNWINIAGGTPDGTIVELDIAGGVGGVVLEGGMTINDWLVAAPAARVTFGPGVTVGGILTRGLISGGTVVGNYTSNAGRTIVAGGRLEEHSGGGTPFLEVLDGGLVDHRAPNGPGQLTLSGGTFDGSRNRTGGTVTIPYALLTPRSTLNLESAGASYEVTKLVNLGGVVIPDPS